MDNTPDPPSKFGTKIRVEINDDLCGTYSQIKVKTTMLTTKSTLCDYSDAYIIVKRTITLTEHGAHAAAMQADRNSKQVIFKNFASFTDCITEINNSQVYNLKDLDVIILMYNLMYYQLILIITVL